ncbi:hypothetical protein M0R36_09665 [bacterium]|jgi:chromosome condensin MukBEF complex kleisin-like MukF subunit|nr:hypothetical protein [bacterium]
MDRVKQLKELVDVFSKKRDKFMETGERSDGLAARVTINEICKNCLLLRKDILDLTKKVRAARITDKNITPLQIMDGDVKKAPKTESKKEVNVSLGSETLKNKKPKIESGEVKTEPEKVEAEDVVKKKAIPLSEFKLH